MTPRSGRHDPNPIPDPDPDERPDDGGGQGYDHDHDHDGGGGGGESEKEEGDEGGEAVFGISEDFVQSPTHLAASTGEFDLDGLLQPPLKLHQDLSEGCGGQLWPAGVVLAKYLLRTKRDQLQRAKSIVELGAGGGLVGLAVALGVQPTGGVVHITDQLPMLGLMQQNIRLNGLQRLAAASVLDWGSPASAEIPGTPDVILAADCVYFEPAFPLLHTTLQQLLGPDGVCYFCFKRRRRADMQFVKLVRKTFEVRPVTDDLDQEAYSRDNIFLLEIRHRAASAAAEARLTARDG